MKSAVLLLQLLPLLLAEWSDKSPKYIEYEEGTGLPLIISAPHGGTKNPDDIRNLTGGVPYADGKTMEIAKGIYEGLVEKFKKAKIQKYKSSSPHLVVSHLHRTKAELNKRIDEALECKKVEGLKCQEEEAAYNAYHGQLEKAVETVDKLGGGLFIDIHGHGVDWHGTMLGYGIGRTDLKNGNLDAKKTTIRHLATKGEKSIEELIKGKSSMGALMEKKGYSAVPSDKNPSPDHLENNQIMSMYFNGGHIVRTYGSMYKGKVDAIQFEFSPEQRWNYVDQPENRNRTINAMIDVIAEYLKLHYGVE